VNRVSVVVYQDPSTEVVASQDVALVYENLRYKAVFEPGKVSFEGRRESDGTVLFTLSANVPGLDLGAVAKVGFQVNESTGTEAWIDNASVCLETGAVLDVALYAGLQISGQVGKSYHVEYVTQLPATTWTPLATVQLTNSPMLWLDTSQAARGRRFYRAVLVP
jgi:hypothetical protein